MNMFGTQLYEDLKTVPTSISIIGGKAEFGANAASEKNMPMTWSGHKQAPASTYLWHGSN
jgi:hypothetical protein